MISTLKQTATADLLKQIITADLLKQTVTDLLKQTAVKNSTTAEVIKIRKKTALIEVNISKLKSTAEQLSKLNI